MKINDSKDKKVAEARNDLTELLFDLGILLHNASQGRVKEASCWLPPLCPRCHSPLSGMVGSVRLVCLRCNKEFELEEVER